jgi:hypothetical protein
MRSLLALALTLALVACGEAEGGGSRPAEPVAAPEEPVSAPARHGATPPAPRACGRLARRLVGRTLKAARSLAEERRCPLRVAIEDGERLALTEDFNPNRINVRVDGGQVTRVLGLY